MRWSFIYICVALFITTTVFALIYYFMPHESFYVLEDNKTRHLNFNEAASMSVSTQTLLGMGDITPASGTARATVMIQSVTTLLVLLWFTSQ